MKNTNIMVSICCITYNQRDYIADALNSFLNQKTNFEYEILIHDDSSTDGTKEIIKKYKDKYPDIIKPIYQIENKYSKGEKINFKYNFPRARGKYIAMCEGDDYWIDENKLQTQVDCLETNENVSLCTHSAIKLSRNEKEIGKVRPSNISRYFDTVEVIHGGGGLFATNSMMFPTNLVQNLPKFCYISPVGDYPLMLFLSLQGKTYYINKDMSVYRVQAKGSWTESMGHNYEKKVRHLSRLEDMLNDFNNYTNYKFQDNIRKHIIDNNIRFIISFADRNMIKSERYLLISDELSIKQKLKIYIKAYLPRIVHLKRNISKIKNGY